MRRLPLALTVLGGVLLVNTIALAVPPLGFPETTDCAQSAPVLCVELPADGPALAAALSDPANTLGAWRQQILLDLPFLVLYALLLAGAGLREHTGSALRVACALLAFGGAALDAVENLGILEAIDHLEAGAAVSDALALRVRTAATGKFTLLSLACALACSAAARRGETIPTRVGLGVPMTLAVIGLASPLSEKVIEVALLAITLSCLALWVRAAHAWWTARRDAKPA